jgi:predicted flavoprotein YhiN
LLRKECASSGVKIVTGCRIQTIDKGFTVSTRLGIFEAASLVIATGGLSIPKIGSTDFGYRVARQFGLRLTALRPGLVPLLFDEPAELHALSGVSFEAEVRCGRTRFRENVLFTHRGLSGPAILQISSYWQPGESITIEAVGHRPRRLERAWPEMEWTVTPRGTEGYAKAEVTTGGVDTNELSSKTMEAKRVPGLYFVGEVVDVTGQLGGFNFQWAWASGFAAGQSV